jgi:cellulose 1,4-beta-cellobiosidase
LIITGTVVAGAAVTGKHPDNGGNGPVICRPDGRRTVHSRSVYYIVRNDVFAPERECIKLQQHGAGFVVIKTHANSGGDNDAFPEVIYGCAWGVCSKKSVLPTRIYRLHQLVTSWGASWRRANGHFNVAYDIWFGHLQTIHGHALGAELMIWLGTKRFGTPTGDPIYRIDGVRWYYARHTACDINYGCWDYMLFRRVVPSTHAYHLGLIPFIHKAEHLHQLAWWWYLKSIDVGFEIWRKGLGLAVHSYSVKIKLWPVPAQEA